jgi:O-antigen/teichoic acid export membrane protein
MTLRKNLISNFILTSSTILFPLITFPYITRTLSNVNIGKVFFVDAFASYFIIFSSIGIPFYGLREVAKIKFDKTKASNLVIELVSIQFTLSIIFSIIFLILYLTVPSLKGNLDLIKIACLTIISSSFLIEWFYQGIENFTYITVRSLILKALSVAFILFFVKNDTNYVLYYLILGLLLLGNAGLNFGNFLVNFYSKFTGKFFNTIHFRALLILFSINVSVSIYTVLDTIILGFLTDPQNVSFYNVPLKLVKMFWMVVGGLGTVLVPRMSSLFADNDMFSIGQLVTKSLSLVFLLTIPFCFFCIVFPKEILFIISGNKYLYAINALRILSIVPFIIGVCNVMGTQFLLPIGQENKILHGTILGLVVSLLFNFILIPHYKFLGTAITCVLSEGTVCLYVLISAIKRIKVIVDYNLILQIVVCIFWCFAINLFLRNYVYKATILLTVALGNYILCFIIVQLFLFKNKFINSIIKRYLPFN